MAKEGKPVGAYTNEIVILKMNELLGDEYTKLDDVYRIANTKFAIRHNSCGFEYTTSWNNIQQGNRCPKCQSNKKGQSQKFTDEIVKQKMFELVGYEYSKLDNTYINARTKFKIKHNNCGLEYEIAWGTFKSGVRCPICAFESARKKRAFSSEDIARKIYEAEEDNYSKVDNEYKNSGSLFKIKHNVCGHIYKTSLDIFNQGVRCPKCTPKSKAEALIEEILEEESINYVAQIKFEDCRSLLPLPFDFGIVDQAKKPILLIEYDGEQHFKPVRFGGISEEKALENLTENQKRDSIKNEYTKQKNIELLRISYKDFPNIKRIVKEKIVSIKTNNNNNIQKEVV